MHAVQKAVQELSYRIPKQILQAAFIDGSTYGRSNWKSSLEDQILALVVRPRVLMDCNLIGGVQQIIPLGGLTFFTPEDYQWATIIHIPKDITFQKTIVSVLDVIYFNAAQMANYVGTALIGSGAAASIFNPNASDNSAMMGAMSAVLQAMDKIPYTSTSRVSLISENTIMIRDGQMVPQNAYLRCYLENDENLTNIPARSYRFFATLCEHAVKSYIYNTLVVQLDQGQLMYGQNLGVFKDIVASYSDAEVNYQDYLAKVWSKVAIFSDTESTERYHRLLIGGYR